MNTIIINDLKNLELHKERSFEEFTLFTNKNENIIIINNYINEINSTYKLKNNLQFKEYISLYILIHFPHILLADETLTNHAKNILNIFYDIEQNKLDNINILDNILNNYINSINIVVSNNKKKLENVYATLYINLELLESKVLYDDVKKDIQNNKKEYLKLLSELIPNDNDIILLLNKLRKETEQDENNLFNQIELTFWKTFETDLKNNNNSSLLKILEEIKNIFASFTPNRKDLLERLETGLNIQYIKQLIDNNCLKPADIHKIFYFLINTMKMYQEPSQDEKLDNFMRIMELSLNNNLPLYEIMPDFFKEYYNLLLILKNRINEIISS
tara:strand:- start:657 stop:1649 length:993 start_codon:yes stop_codon:yes gene_type:complete